MSVYLGLHFSEEQNVFYNHKQLIRLIQQIDCYLRLMVFKHLQQYFSDFVAVSFIDGRSTDLPHVNNKLSSFIAYDMEHMSSPPILSGVRVTRSLV